MAEKRRLYDAQQTHVQLPCPACGQKYLFMGLMIQPEEEMACSRCNALFRLRIDGHKVDAYLVSPATGAPLGPAEVVDRH